VESHKIETKEMVRKNHLEWTEIRYPKLKKRRDTEVRKSDLRKYLDCKTSNRKERRLITFSKNIKVKLSNHVIR